MDWELSAIGRGRTSPNNVSIPDRDFSGLRVCHCLVTPLCLPALFQSLIGILVDWESASLSVGKGDRFVSIPDRDFSGLRGEHGSAMYDLLSVSIPDRDFSGLRALTDWFGLNARQVSIPDRDFSGLRVTWWAYLCNAMYSFQSLIGILVDWEAFSSLKYPALNWFQSLIGILVDWELPTVCVTTNVLVFQSLIGILVDWELGCIQHCVCSTGFNPW